MCTKGGRSYSTIIMRNLANLITCSRIVLSICLLYIPVHSAAFYSLYLLCGFTDVIDGPIARKTHTACETGAVLDTAADCVFVAVYLCKLLPVMQLPWWILLWAAVILLIKACNILISLVRAKRWITAHTFLNRMAGILLFFLPVMYLRQGIGILVCVMTCLAATIAAVQETFIIKKTNL